MLNIGILLTNTGTPSAPTQRAVRRYLREFLSDKRVVQLPRLVWLPILYGLVLPFRSRRSTKLYQKIWTPNGSPMRVIMQNMARQLQKKITSDFEHENIVLAGIEVGMNYGEPSIQQGLAKLHQSKPDKIIVLPLFPQYSNTTTASTLDRVMAALKKWETIPAIAPIRDYAVHPTYIDSLALSVKEAWQKQGRAQHLLISFHGIPERFVKSGDPYAAHCEQTARLLAEALKLSTDDWTLCYQSRFGYDKWLTPSTQALFAELPQRGIKNIDVICPGFAVDCLETLEEIVIRGNEIFLHAGGESLRYIPALNASENHIEMLARLIKDQF